MGRPDYELDYLLSIDGTVLPMSADNTYTAKFSVWRVATNEQIPHGIRYAINLHGPRGPNGRDTRLVGFDNAHGIRGTGPSRIVRWDHKHRLANVTPYEFVSPIQLLTDFYAAAEQMLDELGVKR